MLFSFNSEGVGVQLEFLEVDENLPNSLQFSVNVELAHPTGAFSFSASDIWLDTEMWDLFEEKLASGLTQPALFHDQSNYFEIHLIREAAKLKLMLSIREPVVPKGEILLSSSQNLDIDGAFINQLRRSFKTFPKFW